MQLNLSIKLRKTHLDLDDVLSSSAENLLWEDLQETRLPFERAFSMETYSPITTTPPTVRTLSDLRNMYSQLRSVSQK
jgi:hypothetical protein